jgi:hypothetical protein
VVPRLEHPARAAGPTLTLDPTPGRRLASRAAHSTDASPLTADHFRIIADARTRARKVFRAASIATVSGWLTAIFAAITILTSITSPAGLALGIGMALIAWNEFRGAALFRAFDLRGPRRLAIGQLALGAMVAAYAGWGVFATLTAPSVSGSSDPQVDAMLAEINLDGLYRSINLMIYAAIALAGILVPGLTALYYQTRAGCIRTFHTTTPGWAVQALAA